MNVVRAVVGACGCAIGVVLVTACGDVYADPDPLEDSTADAAVAVRDTGPSPPVFPTDTLPRCPRTRPRENSACEQSGSVCEYGPSADAECNTTVACEGAQFQGAWAPRPHDTCFSNACPDSGDVSTLDGKPCELDANGGADGGAITDADEAVCNMTDGVCACTTGRDGASKHERRWVCVKPLSACPPNRPLLGRTCNGSVWCDYGSCAFKRGLVMECIEGLWLTGGATCE